MSVSWMLLQKSGRQSFVRLGLTTAAVALGIVLVCCFTVGINGIKEIGDDVVMYKEIHKTVAFLKRMKIDNL